MIQERYYVEKRCVNPFENLCKSPSVFRDSEAGRSVLTDVVSLVSPMYRKVPGETHSHSGFFDSRLYTVEVALDRLPLARPASIRSFAASPTRTTPLLSRAISTRASRCVVH